eukprot:1437595-Rhodomonas_salina.1
MSQIARECSQACDGRTLVFCYTRADTEKLHTLITQQGKTQDAQSAMVYHGQVAYEQRERVQKWFKDGVVTTVVATGSSFGTGASQQPFVCACYAIGDIVRCPAGVDVPDVRRIFICGLPKTFEDYFQQMGRAGRDGKKSTVKLFFGKGDCRAHLCRKMPTDRQHLAMAQKEKNSLFTLLRFCNDKKTCRRQILMRFWNQSQPGLACGDCDNCCVSQRS